MKRLWSIILAAVLILTLTACGKPGKPEGEDPSGKVYANQVCELLDNGLVCTQIMADESVWKALIQTEGSYEKVYIAEAAITSEQYRQYDAIPMDAEDYEEQLFDYIAELKGITVTDVTGEIPSDEDFNNLVGKTVGELEDLGYENLGYWIADEGGMELDFQSLKYAIVVGICEDETPESMEAMPEENFRSLTIKYVHFQSLGGCFLN